MKICVCMGGGDEPLPRAGEGGWTDILATASAVCAIFVCSISDMRQGPLDAWDFVGFLKFSGVVLWAGNMTGMYRDGRTVSKWGKVGTGGKE